MEEPTVLFEIFGFPINSYMTTMTAITILLSVIGILAARNAKIVPSGLQNGAEWVLESLLNFFTTVMGEVKARRFLPLLATFFIFILTSNYSGLLPLAGHLPGFSPPTATLSVTVALALITFVSTHYFGVKDNGLHYFSHFCKPVAFLLPLMLIEELVRPLSLSLRLYGNIFGEEMATSQIFQLAPLFAPLVMNALGLLMGFVQALVFTLLTSIYIDGATSAGH